MADNLTGVFATEEEKVAAWRERCFLDMEFNTAQASALARSADADVHAIKKWLDGGCDHATALRLVGLVVEVKELAVPTS